MGTENMKIGAATITEKMNLAKIQREYLRSKARFTVVPAGRRTGKTAIAKRRLRRKAIGKAWPVGTRIIAAAPTFNQAKRIYWNDLQLMFPTWMRRDRINKTELIIPLITGADVQVLGMEVPERSEGSPIGHILCDEFGNWREEAWGENIYPALMDMQGTADIIGVPEGRNHYYRMYMDATRRFQATPKGEIPEWNTFAWTAEEILPYYLGDKIAEKEIANAKATMDQMTYDQEYNASFLTFQGRAYYMFDRDVHGGERVTYNPNLPLIFCHDFNVAPGVAAVCQEQRYRGTNKKVDEYITAVIGEVWIPKGSNTKRVARKLIADWGPEGKRHQGQIHVYGDATGGAGGSAAVEGSDTEVLLRELKSVFGDQIRDRFPKGNPRERARVNAVNARCATADKIIHLLVDPVNASHVIDDLDGVTVIEGTAGELDKDIDKSLTHISDALGYYLYDKYPVHNEGLITTGGV
ncbi:MAG: hypothetical protein HC828_08705 [Blastochloris sp.]|nr:hypothetical protein [Blastochloris sp.]